MKHPYKINPVLDPLFSKEKYPALYYADFFLLGKRATKTSSYMMGAFVPSIFSLFYFLDKNAKYIIRKNMTRTQLIVSFLYFVSWHYMLFIFIYGGILFVIDKYYK